MASRSRRDGYPTHPIPARCEDNDRRVRACARRCLVQPVRSALPEFHRVARVVARQWVGARVLPLRKRGRLVACAWRVANETFCYTTIALPAQRPALYGNDEEMTCFF